MQLTRCCFVFLVQGSLYLVSGPRGAGRAGARGWGERGKLRSPETFSLPPPGHPGDAANAGGWERGRVRGQRPDWKG